MKSAASVLSAFVLTIGVGCAGTAVAPTAPPTTPTAASIASPQVKPAPSPSPSPSPPPPTATAAPKPTAAPSPAAAVKALPTVERSRTIGDPSFLTHIDLELEFEQAVPTDEELVRVVDGVLELNGVASARSDGKHLSVRYDSQRVLPDRIRDRMRELGHPAVTGTDVQNPGDAAD